MTQAGIDPTAVAICWTEESYGVYFYDYEVLTSAASSSGPWALVETISASTTTCSVIHQALGGGAYWEVEYFIALLGIAALESTTNAIHTAQPATASLTLTPTGDTSVGLAWTNNAQYGGGLSFGQYRIYEVLPTPLLLYTITSATDRDGAVGSLTYNTMYCFNVTTADVPASANAISASNRECFTTPLSALAVTATATPTSVDVGQNVAFSCTTTGGAGDDHFAWSFGDGNTGSVQTPTHAYSSPGTMVANCTVTDQYGSSAKGAASVQVSPLPTVTTPLATTGGSVQAGKLVTFSVTTTVGSGGLHYVWLGLPAGCASADAPTISCSPSSSATGAYRVSVTVTDSNGGSVTSAALLFTVTAPPATFLGLPATEGYAVLGAGIVVVAACGVVVWRTLVHRRRRPTPVAAS